VSSYAELLTKFGTAQAEMAKALTVQRQQVLGDQSLLGLVGQVRAAGTWNLDVFTPATPRLRVCQWNLRSAQSTA
jgi:hypothetical protein